MNCRIGSIHLNNTPGGLNFKAMPVRSPINAQDKVAARPARSGARVMVAVIAGPEASLVAGPKDLPRWRRLTPLALWSTVSLRDAGPDAILHGIAEALARQDVGARRLVLVGEGDAGRCALELVLQGALDCAGMLAIAIPCAALPFRIVPPAAAVRLVVRRQDCDGAQDDLIAALRAADMDERIIRLDLAASYDERATASAAETFVLELVANASRQSRHGV
jgi:hypothetical protein